MGKLLSLRQSHLSDMGIFECCYGIEAADKGTCYGRQSHLPSKRGARLCTNLITYDMDNERLGDHDRTNYWSMDTRPRGVAVHTCEMRRVIAEVRNVPMPARYAGKRDPA